MKSRPSRHLFLALLCSWCLWSTNSGARASLQFLAKEYIGRLDSCRCVPFEVHCDEEVVAFSFLSSYTHSVKVCAEGTRLCCHEAPSSMEIPSESPKEDSYFLVLKVPPSDHRGNSPRQHSNILKTLSRSLRIEHDATTSGDNETNVTGQQEQNETPSNEADEAFFEEGSGNRTTTESIQNTSTPPVPVAENISASWLNETGDGEGKATESPTDVDVVSSTTVINPNASEEDFAPFSFSPMFNVSGEWNETTTTILNKWSSSNVTSRPSSDSAGCFVDACRKNTTNVLHRIATSESRITSFDKDEGSQTADSTLNVSVVANIPSNSEDWIPISQNYSTEAPYPIDNAEADRSALHQRTTASSPKVMPTASTRKQSPAAGMPATHFVYGTARTQRPRLVSTTTPTPSFWMWLFG